MVSEFPFVTSPWLPPLPLSCLYLESIMSEHHAKVKPEKKVKVQILQRRGGDKRLDEMGHTEKRFS